jgi:beta-glucosidase
MLNNRKKCCKFILLGLVLVCFLVPSLALGFSYTDPNAPYLDPNRSITDRVTDLMSRLSLTQKLLLLKETNVEIPGLMPEYMFGNECLHGVVRPGKFTIFPQAIGLASTWDTNLHLNIATTISDEARAKHNQLGGVTPQYSGVLTFFSPTINMARDPRWGRTAETYGEDPYLSGRLAVNFVKGLQGNDPKYVKTIATLKHYAANNQEYNRFNFSATITEKVLREYYLAAFKTGVIEGKAQAVMSAYNAVNTVPCTANKMLLTDILRTEWGFDGYVVSDCGAVGNIYTQHHYVTGYKEAAAAALNAGVDLECGEGTMRDYLDDALSAGLVTQATIDQAVRRELTARFRLGMFDNPSLVPYSTIPATEIGAADHVQLALQACRESLVLLKNDNVAGTPLLPINKSGITSITVLGMNAATCQYGDYSCEAGPANTPISPLDGIKNKVGSQVQVKYVPYPGNGYVVIPNDRVTYPGNPNQHGWKGEYYPNGSLSGNPITTRVDSAVDFNKTVYPPDPHFPEGGTSPFSVRWTGMVTPATTGDYKLGATSDDGLRLYVDGVLKIDKWINRSATRDEITLTLQAGHQYEIKMEYFDNGGDAVAKLEWYPAGSDTLDAAKQAAASSDLVIAFMGTTKDYEREGQDRSDITLPADQTTYLQGIYSSNPKIVLVLINGGPLAFNWEKANLPSIVEAWYPGEQGGNGIADVLFGDYNPAGRMPVTSYTGNSQLPSFDDYDITKGRTYMYFGGDPLYPFGYGLSYTTFTYSNLQIGSGTINPTGSVTVSADVQNTGSRAGDEVLQLYVHDVTSSAQRPFKELKGFQRVSLQPNEKKTVTFTLLYDDLSFFDVYTKKFMVENGAFDLMVGSSSKDIRLTGQLTAAGGLDQSPVNLAQGKTATADTYVTAEPPSKAVDGTVPNNSKWCATGAEPHWLKVDLGANYDINKFVVKHAGAGCETIDYNTKDFKIQTSNDGTTWTDRITVTGNTAGVTGHFVSGVNTRYIRLYITKATQVADTSARIYEFEAWSGGGRINRVNLTSYYNQDGFSYDTNRGDGAYDPGTSPVSTYSADLLNINPAYDGVPYQLGPKIDGQNNAIKCTGQTITLPQGMYASLRFLGSATNGNATGTFRINYTDNTYTDVSVTGKDWCTADTTGEKVVQTMAHRHRNAADQTVNTYVFAYYLTPTIGKTVASLGLPNVSNMHVLAISLVEPLEPVIVAIKANANGKFVCADTAGTSPLIANRTTAGVWEIFEKFDFGGGKIALRAVVNTKFVCADNGGANPLIANRPGIGQWETYDLADLGNGKVSLKANANNKYVCADNSGSSPLIANRTSAGAWETFELIPQ